MHAEDEVLIYIEDPRVPFAVDEDALSPQGCYWL